MGVLKVLHLTVSNLGWCRCLERIDFNSFNFGKGMAVFKEQIFKLFLHWEGVAVMKNLNLTVSTLQGCGGIESAAFNSFSFARVWWS